MTKTVLHLLSSLAFGLITTGVSQASTPAEKIICTQVPRSEWLPEAKIKEIFDVKRFTLAKLKISRGNCYEFYAVHPDGSIVEAYYDPVSGKEIRYNRVTSKNTEPVYLPHTTAPAH